MVFEGVQVEGSVQETLQLQQVGILASGSRSSSRFTTSIPRHTNTHIMKTQTENLHEFINHEFISSRSTRSATEGEFITISRIQIHFVVIPF